MNNTDKQGLCILTNLYEGVIISYKSIDYKDMSLLP